MRCSNTKFKKKKSIIQINVLNICFVFVMLIHTSFHELVIKCAKMFIKKSINRTSNFLRYRYISSNFYRIFRLILYRIRLIFELHKTKTKLNLFFNSSQSLGQISLDPHPLTLPSSLIGCKPFASFLSIWPIAERQLSNLLFSFFHVTANLFKIISPLKF